jgi:hypothetical protein
MLKALPYIVAALVAIAGIIQGINALNNNTIKNQEIICLQAKENELLVSKNRQDDYFNKTAEKYQFQKTKIQNNPVQEIGSIPVRDVLDWMRDNCKDGYAC